MHTFVFWWGGGGGVLKSCFALLNYSLFWIFSLFFLCLCLFMKGRGGLGFWLYDGSKKILGRNNNF